jgi:hypothetical protein
MAHAKQASKRKRQRTTLPVFGVAGASLAMAGGASATAPMPNVPSQDVAPRPMVTLGEEEISAGAAAAAAVCRRELAAGARLDLPIRAPSVGRSPSELTLEQRPRSVRDDVLSGRELHLGHWSDISQNARQRCSLELILLLRLVADRNV